MPKPNGGADSEAGEVMIPWQWGHGPVVGGNSLGIRIFPLQWMQWNSLRCGGIEGSDMNGYPKELPRFFDD